MRIIYLVSFLFCLMTFLPLHGNLINFRSGTIIAAELTSGTLNIRNLDPAAFPNLPAKRMYAILSVNVSAGRQISIFDYSLENSGITYSCVAINSGNGFTSTERNFSAGKRQLLFIIDSQQKAKLENIKIKCNLPPTDGTYDIEVPFRNIGSAQPVKLDKIPAAGLLEKR